MNKNVETIATFEDLESSKGIIEIRFQADNCSFFNQMASISYVMRVKIETDNQPFLDGKEITNQDTFILEGEEFDEFWANSDSELYEFVLEKLGVIPSKVVKHTSIYGAENPAQNGMVSVEL